jgi:hypothetical protein
VTSAGVASADILVLDAMELIHFALAERLDVFRDLLADNDCWTTRVVIEEVRRGAPQAPVLRGEDVDWISIAELDTLAEISCSSPGCNASVPVNAISEKPACSRRLSFAAELPSLTIGRQ